MAKVAEIVRVLPRAVPVGPEAPGGLCFILILLSQASDDALADAAGLERASLQSIVRAAPELAADREPVPSAVDALDGAEDGKLDPLARRGVVRVDASRLDEAMEGLSAL